MPSEPTVFQQRTYRAPSQPHPGRPNEQGSRGSLLTTALAEPTTKTSVGPGLGDRSFLFSPT